MWEGRRVEKERSREGGDVYGPVKLSKSLVKQHQTRSLKLVHRTGDDAWLSAELLKSSALPASINEIHHGASVDRTDGFRLNFCALELGSFAVVLRIGACPFLTERITPIGDSHLSSSHQGYELCPMEWFLRHRILKVFCWYSSLESKGPVALC